MTHFCFFLYFIILSGIDDPIGVFSVHWLGSVIGFLSVGFFAENPVPLPTTQGRAGLFMGKSLINSTNLKERNLMKIILRWWLVAPWHSNDCNCLTFITWINWSLHNHQNCRQNYATQA